MRKILKSVLVASLAMSALTACSAPPAISGGINTQSVSSSSKASFAIPKIVHKITQTEKTIKPPTTKPAPPVKANPAPISNNGIHAVAIGLGISGNTQFQQQPSPGSCHVYKAANGQPLPDPKCTPGTTNSAVTQATLATTICRSGYTSSIRPTSSITGREKKANAASYSYTGSLSNAEYDHLISLELGGSPNDAKNLWVEPGGPDWKPADKFRNDKDSVENKLKSLVCSHQVTLAAAQSAIANDWTTALTKVNAGG